MVYNQKKIFNGDDQRGFTLVELLFGLSLFMIIMGAVLSSTIMSSRMVSNIMAQSDTGQRIRYMQELLARDVRSSTDVDVASASRVTLTTPDDEEIDYIVDSSNASNIRLIRDDENGDQQVLLNNLNIAQFSVPTSSNTDLQLDISIEVSVNGGIDATKTLQSHFTSRAAKF